MQDPPKVLAFLENIGCEIAGGDWKKYHHKLEEWAFKHPEIQVVIVHWANPFRQKTSEKQNQPERGEGGRDDSQGEQKKDDNDAGSTRRVQGDASSSKQWVRTTEKNKERKPHAQDDAEKAPIPQPKTGVISNVRDLLGWNNGKPMQARRYGEGIVDPKAREDANLVVRICNCQDIVPMDEDREWCDRYPDDSPYVERRRVGDELGPPHANELLTFGLGPQDKKNLKYEPDQARRTTWDSPGSVRFVEPPKAEDGQPQKPVVALVFSQLRGRGPIVCPEEENANRQPELPARGPFDTEQQRLIWLRQCITKLKEEARHFRRVLLSSSGFGPGIPLNEKAYAHCIMHWSADCPSQQLMVLGPDKSKRNLKINDELTKVRDVYVAEQQTGTMIR